MNSMPAIARRKSSQFAFEAPLSAAARRLASPSTGKRAHVLLVDDDQELMRAVKLRLRGLGYAVTAAFDGESGLRAALESAPDAIILDMRMPRMDGLTMLAKLRGEEKTRRSPVILLSGFMREDDKRRALHLGTSFFIEKPYDSLVLVEAVRQATGR